MKTFTIFNIPITLINPQELPVCIDDLLAHTANTQIVTINPEFLVEAYYNKPYGAVLAAADLATADGTGIIFAARFKGTKARLSERVTGIRLTQMLLAKAQEKNLRVTILLKHNSLTSKSELTNALAKRYPRLQASIVEESLPLTDIIATKPDLLFVAFGSPAQDFWIHKHKTQFLDLRIAIGIGGTFDFISGKMQRAPVIVQYIGLEWLWRLLLEPWRLPRILRATLLFPYLVLTKS